MSLSNPFQQALSLYAPPAGSTVSTVTVASNTAEVGVNLPPNTYQFTIAIAPLLIAGPADYLYFQLGNDTTWYNTNYHGLSETTRFRANLANNSYATLVFNITPTTATVALNQYSNGSFQQLTGYLSSFASPITRVRFYYVGGLTLIAQNTKLEVVISP
jgi:hypothetical protein